MNKEQKLKFEEFKNKYNLNVEIEDKENYYDEELRGNRTKYIINVLRDNKKIDQFDFYDSIQNYKDKEQSDLYYMLYCRISDSIFLESEDIKSFCEYLKYFGDNQKCDKAYKTYKDLVEINKKLTELFKNDDLYNMCNELQEIEELY